MTSPPENDSGRERAPRPADPNRLGRTDRTGPELDRLPPPVFPPGSRRTAVRYQAASTMQEGGEDAGVPADAFISPDEPIRRSDEWDEALISPDDPIVRREPPRAPADGDDVEVTGIGAGERVYPDEVLSANPIDVERLAGRLETLARDLREKGAAALRVPPDADGTDAVLRAFLSGYLEGRNR